MNLGGSSNSGPTGPFDGSTDTLTFVRSGDPDNEPSFGPTFLALRVGDAVEEFVRDAGGIVGPADDLRLTMIANRDRFGDCTELF